MEKNGGNREDGREVSEMVIEGGGENTGVYGKEGTAKGEIKGESGHEGMGILKEDGRRKEL